MTKTFEELDSKVATIADRVTRLEERTGEWDDPDRFALGLVDALGAETRPNLHPQCGTTLPELQNAHGRTFAEQMQSETTALHAHMDAKEAAIDAHGYGGAGVTFPGNVTGLELPFPGDPPLRAVMGIDETTAALKRIDHERAAAVDSVRQLTKERDEALAASRAVQEQAASDRKFLNGILGGLEGILPRHTQRTVNGIVDAVKEIAEGRRANSERCLQLQAERESCKVERDMAKRERDGAKAARDVALERADYLERELGQARADRDSGMRKIMSFTARLADIARGWFGSAPQSREADLDTISNGLRGWREQLATATEERRQATEIAGELRRKLKRYETSTVALDIVFDGPPSHESGRFVEVETEDGKSVNAGEWIARDNGMWALRLRRQGASIAEREALAQLEVLRPRVRDLQRSREGVGEAALALITRLEAHLANCNKTITNYGDQLERLRPFAGPIFPGENMADAMIRRVQMFESEHGEADRQLADTIEQRDKAIADRDSLGSKCSDGQRRLGELQLKNARRVSTIADQAQQIAELREQLRAVPIPSTGSPA